MKQAHQEFLDLLRAALKKERIPVQLKDDELREVLALAVRQHLLPVILEAITTSPASSTLSTYKQLVMQQVIRQAEHSIDFYALYRNLRRDGLHPVVVKGSLCSRLYPVEYHRISADDDLYISKAEIPACHKALLRCGLHTETPEELLEKMDEITYRDGENYLYIELHRALFSTGTATLDDLNQFFSNVFEETAELDGLLSMTPHTHLLYLLLHAYKHFIYSGVGIRQTCDIALWARQYGDQIDWELLLKQCRSVHADLFAAAQFRISEKDLGIRLYLPECWASLSVDTEPMLLDMFDGGVFGDDSLTRLHTSTATLNAIEKSRSGGKGSILRSVFPSREYMAGRYSYVRQHPILLPAAWACRILHYFNELGQSNHSSASGSVKLAKERITLMKQYGVIR